MASHQGVITLALAVVLLALPSLTDGVTLHVRPTSTNSSCPTQPCHTLSEYAQYPGRYFNDSNLTLQLLPGNHTVNANLTITSIYQLEILGHFSTLVPTRIVCSLNVGFTFRNISRMRIDCLAFVACARSQVVSDGPFTTYYGAYLQSVQAAEIIDCTFQDSYGSALGVVDSHVVLRGNNSFLNNCWLSSYERCCSCSATCYGGGVFVQESDLTIIGSSSFIGNSAGNGGGVYAWFKSNVKISGNTTFIDNMAILCDGVYSEPNSNANISENATFICNLVGRDDIHGSGYGGGVYMSENSNVSISGNTKFIGNLASGQDIHRNYNGNGGGIYIGFSSNAYINGNTIFISNLATGHDLFGNGNGGGICLELLGNVTINGNTTFIGNSVRRSGGGIYATLSSNVDISGNTTFIGNSAGKGGAVSALSSSNVNIRGETTFVGNSAYNGGGASAVSYSNMNINGTTYFIGNSATFGGGLYVTIHSNVKTTGNTIFTSNSAVKGGCIFLGSSLSLEEKTSFTNCSANDGGAIYAIGIQVNFSGTNVFSANRAAHFGGGLYAKESTINLPGDNLFTANWAGTKGGGIYTQASDLSFSGTGLLSTNVAQLDGGGIYAEGSNLNFSGNLTIRNNTAQLGGGVYSDNNAFNIDGHNVVEMNIATHYGGGIFTRRCPLTVTGKNTFIANTAGEGGGIYATANTTLKLNGLNSFKDNKALISGGGIWLDNSKLALNGSNHFVECAASYEGGAIFTYAATASLTGNNTFESNSATAGGGIHARWSSVRITKNSSFTNNLAVFGGAIFTDNSTFEFNGSSTFSSNHADYTGGGIYAARSILTFLVVSSITANYAARGGGGIYTRDECVVNLLGLSNYQGNSAGDTGGGISAYRSSFNLSGQSTFNSNHAVEGGGFYAFYSNVSTQGENIFTTNSASSHGGGFTIMHGILHLNGSTTFKNNSAASGGGLYIVDSTVDSDGSNCFTNNIAKSSGGGIYAADSTVKFNKNDMLLENSARNKGAAIHSSFTTLVFQGSSSFVNNSAKHGGGIHSESSNLTFVHHGSSHYTTPCINYKSVYNESLDPENIFHNNTAIRGGALYFDIYSNFSLYETACVRFQDNHATEFGGAIYSADVLGPGQFLSQQQIPYRSKCFFHMLRKEGSPDLDTSPLIFANNTAGIRGSILYGGLLEKCTFISERYTSTIELFSISILYVGREDNMGHSISSDPSQLCFCNTSELNCREVMRSRSIYPGQQVAVSVVAIDQSGSAIPTLIHTQIHSGHNLTVSEIISYETGGICTYRNYSVTTMNNFNQLELYPNNRSGNTIHLVVNITFESCPIGFEQSNFTGECICDHRLWQYTNSCDIDRQAIMRNATRTFWLGVSYNNGTVEGFIHHRYCPLSYCTSESKHINLINPDKQCNYNRSGLLCGKCKKNFSLILGSSQCKQCGNNYLVLFVPFALAGVLLVILLFLLRLTVTAGILHGLTFYANIVAANHHIFFPHTTNDPASIFIAWLNLDLGIQTCFYNGMDAYTKTWLEFVFPVYIWVIVGLLVYISHHSVTVTKLLGSSPVPVLATLFLLSYAKVLRTIIAALSLTILHYPDKDVVVWMHDANVPLAKYIPLALVALIFLLFLFLPYTLLLFLGQWLQPKSHLCLLCWVRSPKVKAIVDTYHAPYKPKHRYWTGLLLLVRCTLFLVFAFNLSGDTNVNLLVISSTSFGIIGWLTFSGVVYKSSYLNAIEVSFILNLGMLAVATFYVTLSGGSQAAVAYTSVGIAFLTFVGIVIYHIYIRIKSKVQYIQHGDPLQHENNCHRNNNNDNPGNLCHQPRATPAVTRTEVNLHELRSPLDLLSYHQMD